jgi:hypothetical protein
MPFQNPKAREAFFASRKNSPGPNSGVPFQGKSAPAIPTFNSGMKSQITSEPAIKPVSEGMSAPRFGQLAGFLKKKNPGMF